MGFGSANRDANYVRKLPQLLGQSAGITQLILEGDALKGDREGYAVKKFVEFSKLETLEIGEFIESKKDEERLASIFRVLAGFGKLQRLRIGGWLPPSCLAALSTLPLQALEISVEALDDTFVSTIAQLTKLEQLSVSTPKYQPTDLKPWKPLSSLRMLYIWDGVDDASSRVRNDLIDIGLVRQETFDVTIGDFYETGKEEPGREFISTHPSLSGGAFQLEEGDYLEILENDGSLLFAGELRPVEPEVGLWTQSGIDKTTWHTWFVAGKKARLKMWCIVLEDRVIRY